jgi:hypothetical protein
VVLITNRATGRALMTLVTTVGTPVRPRCGFLATDLVGERAIFRREHSVDLSAGLSAPADVLATITVNSVAAALQTAVLTAIVVIGKGAPKRGAVVCGSPIFELYATLAFTAVISAINGMVLSFLAKSQDQALPMLVMSQILLMALAVSHLRSGRIDAVVRNGTL